MPLGRAQGDVTVSRHMIDWLIACNKASRSSNGISIGLNGVQEAAPVTIALSGAAIAMGTPLAAEVCLAKAKALGLKRNKLYARVNESILRFALIRAYATIHAVLRNNSSAIDTSRIIVDADTMQWAVNLSRITARDRKRSVRQELSANTAWEKAERISGAIKQAGGKGLTKAELCKSHAGALPTTQFEDLIDDLTKEGSIVLLSNMNSGKRGRPRTAYVHVEHLPQESRVALARADLQPVKPHEQGNCSRGPSAPGIAGVASTVPVL